ncbi:MAG: xylulokinase [Myxococcota bacterium]
MALVAGVDSSTQSTKVEVRDADTGALVASGRAPHPAVTPPCAEQDPESWWRAFERAWSQAGSPRVEAIAVAAQQHGLVPLDDAGRVIRPAKLWCDTTSAPDAAWLIDQLDGGAAAWAEACGNVPVASFPITKLSWLHRSEPESWQRLARVCLPHDWLTRRLCGAFVSDRGDASGTGYWSASKGQYRLDLLALVDAERDWTHALPAVLGPAEAAGRWGSDGPIVAAGTGDNMAAALGLGVGPGDVVVSIGTSGTIYSVSEVPVTDASGSVCGFADATGRYLPLVCTLNAAKVTDAFGRLLGVSAEELDALGLAGEPGAGGLTLLPYLDGERTPDRPDARGVLRGLRSDVSREQLARACIEGVVCGLLDGLDALTRVTDARGALTLAGGGARSAAYRRVLADLSGRPVRTLALEEAVAAGACVQAAAAVLGAAPEQVRAAWSLGAETWTEPDACIDRSAIRQAYAACRDREAGLPSGGGSVGEAGRGPEGA